MDEQKNCMNNCKEMSPACVSFFVHENTVEHLSMSNKRMLISLLAVCITFILTIVIFVVGYTIREKNWLNTLTRLQTETPVTEVQNGVHEQPD